MAMTELETYIVNGPKELLDWIYWSQDIQYRQYSIEFALWLVKQGKVTLLDVLYYQSVPEKVIREQIGNCNTTSHWYAISSQKLSLDFIREFADNLDWCSLSRRQSWTESAIREFADRLHWATLIRNKHAEVTKELKQEFPDMM